MVVNGAIGRTNLPRKAENQEDRRFSDKYWGDVGMCRPHLDFGGTTPCSPSKSARMNKITI